MGGEVRPGALAPSLNRVITSRLFRLPGQHTKRTGTRPPRACSATATGGATIGPNIIDFLTMLPDARRQVVPARAEIDAANP